jgi:hypothetical protein
MDASTAGGFSVRRAKLLKRPLRRLFRPLDRSDDRLDDLSFISRTIFAGYSFTSHGRETMRHALIMVVSASIMVQIVEGVM